MMQLFKVFTGNCAITYDDEDIYEINWNRIESFVTVAITREEAVQNVRAQYNADALEDETARLEVIVLTEEPALGATHLVEFMGWTENDGPPESDEELQSM